METIVIERNKHNPNEYENFKWLLQARPKSTSTTRPMLSYIGIFKHRAVCTDGARMYMILHIGYKPGNYKVVSSDKASIVLQEVGPEEGTFPDVKQVIPKKKCQSIKNISNSKKMPGRAYTLIVRKMPENSTLDYDYCDQTLGEDKEWTVRITPEGGPIRFQNHGKSALIMPMRLLD